MRGQVDLEASMAHWPKPYETLNGMRFEPEIYHLVGDSEADVDRLWHIYNVKGCGGDTPFVKETLCGRYDYVKRIRKCDVTKDVEELIPKKLTILSTNFKCD